MLISIIFIFDLNLRPILSKTIDYNFQTFIGKAEILNEELTRHFECFGKRQKEIREIDDDLCHHTYAGGWKVIETNNIIISLSVVQ